MDVSNKHENKSKKLVEISKLAWEIESFEQYIYNMQELQKCLMQYMIHITK